MFERGCGVWCAGKVTGIVSLLCNSYYVTMLHFGSEGCLRGGVELGVRGR